MATYAFSDVHGHRAALDRLLSRVSPADDDSLFMLGDMIDRGPDAVGVLSIVRSFRSCTTLMGNHEKLMLAALDNPEDQRYMFDWTFNGGGKTVDSLSTLERDAYEWFVDWIRALPTYATCEAAGRRYLFAHAGIRPGVAPAPRSGMTAPPSRSSRHRGTMTCSGFVTASGTSPRASWTRRAPAPSWSLGTRRRIT